jgi:hypothetical protein
MPCPWVESRVRTEGPPGGINRRASALPPTAERLAVGPGYVDHDLAVAMPDGRPLHPDRFLTEANCGSVERASKVARIRICSPAVLHLSRLRTDISVV